MCSAKTRASVVVAPPAGNGTIMVTGRDGYTCALATRDAAGTAVAPAASCKNCLRVSFIAVTSTRAASFDHLVGGDEQLVGHSETEHPGCLVVDDQFELARLHDRQVRGICALEEATCINAHLTIRIRNVASVTHQPADFGNVT